MTVVYDSLASTLSMYRGATLLTVQGPLREHTAVSGALWGPIKTTYIQTQPLHLRMRMRAT